MALPDLPAAAKANTPDGAAAFARYYLELVNYAWQKPDPTPLTKYSDPTCKSCAAFIAEAADLRAHNRRYDRAPLVVKSADPSSSPAPGAHSVIVTLDQVRSQVVSSSGSVVKTDRARPLVAQLTMVMQAGTWRVQKIKGSA